MKTMNSAKDRKLLNEKIDISGAELKSRYGLQDLLKGVYELSVQTKFPGPVRNALMKSLADIEYRLSRGAVEKIQSAALVASFFEAREGMKKA